MLLQYVKFRLHALRFSRLTRLEQCIGYIGSLGRFWRWKTIEGIFVNLELVFNVIIIILDRILFLGWLAVIETKELMLRVNHKKH